MSSIVHYTGFSKAQNQLRTKQFKHIQSSQVIVFFSTKYKIELFHQAGAVIEARMGGTRVTAGPCPCFRTLQLKMWKKVFLTLYICDKYRLRPSHHINHSQRSQIYIVVLTTTLELGLTTPDQSSPPHPWLAHSTSPVSRPNIAEFVTRIDPAWIFGLMEKILSKKISSFIRRDKWLLYLMDTRILNHKEITRRWCWWNSRHMYSYYFVKLILISRKLKYFIVTCESHLSYPSYPSSTNDFLLSSRMSWKYNCLSFSPMTNIQPKTISRVCVSVRILSIKLIRPWMISRSRVSWRTQVFVFLS